MDPGGTSGFNPLTGGLAGVSGGVSGKTGPSGPDPVNLASGRESFNPPPDLTVYNPSGPSAVWQLSYSSDQALKIGAGYGSPGLSRGWINSYDLRVEGTLGSWGTLKLIYPNGATETLTPQLDGGGQPTGSLTTPQGAPYIAQGVAGSPAGTWQSITVTWKDQTKWVFSPFSSGVYALNQLTNRTGQGISFTWRSTDRALTQIADTGSSAGVVKLELR
jgi:hypothetical protein